MMPTGRPAEIETEIESAPLQTLLHRLRQERRRIVRLGWVCLGGWGGALCFLVTAILYEPRLLYLAMALSCAVACLHSSFAESRLSAQLLAEADRLRDRRLIGAYIDLLETALYVAPGQKTTLVRLLSDLLPTLDASHAPLLTLKQRQALYVELSWRDPYEDSVFLVAILTGLMQIGDTRVLPYARSLTRVGAGASSQERQVMQAARECVQRLEAVQEAVQNNATLLRPLEGASRTDDLLRRIEAREEETPETLLRSSASPAREKEETP
jgi:hypothetical protein